MLFLSTLDDCMDPLICFNQQPVQPQSVMTECLDLRMLLGQKQFFPQQSQQSYPLETKQMLINNQQTAASQQNSMSPTGRLSLVCNKLMILGPCGLCTFPILDKEFLLIGGKSWHFNCARCAECGQNLEGHQTCYLKNNSLFCKQDYTA